MHVSETHGRTVLIILILAGAFLISAGALIRGSPLIGGVRLPAFTEISTGFLTHLTGNPAGGFFSDLLAAARIRTAEPLMIAMVIAVLFFVSGRKRRR